MKKQMTEFGILRLRGVSFAKSVWMKVFLGLIVLNAGIYLATQSLFPGNPFTVPIPVLPAVLLLYALWWWMLIKTLWGVISALKTLKLSQMLGWLLILILGAAFGGVLYSSQVRPEIMASVMTFGIGSGLAWLSLLLLKVFLAAT